MNYKAIFSVIMITLSGIAAAQVGIGVDEDPHESSVLELRSSDKGFLLPRMTTAQRDSIANPANGLMVYNTSSVVKSLEVFRKLPNGESAWFTTSCPEVLAGLDSSVGIFFSDSSNLSKGSNGDQSAASMVSASGDFVNSVGPFNLGFVDSSLGAAYFNLVDQGENGTNGGNNSITYDLKTAVANDYTANGFLNKTRVSSSGWPDHLLLDLGSNEYTGDFTITLIARYNTLPSGDFNAFFSVGNNVNRSFQLDNRTGAGTGRFSLGLRSAVMAHTLAVPVDTAFHTFVIVKDTSAPPSELLKFYIDGNLVGATANDVIIQDNIRLFVNRSGNTSSDSSIAYFSIEGTVKTLAEIENVSKQTFCLTNEF